MGPDFLELGSQMMSSDSEVAIAATRKFVRACTRAPLPADIWETALRFNMLTPPQVRRWLTERRLDFTGVLRELKVPTLVTIGMLERIVTPRWEITSSTRCRARSPHGTIRSGTLPFLEDAARFNRELRSLGHKVANYLSVKPRQPFLKEVIYRFDAEVHDALRNQPFPLVQRAPIGCRIEDKHLTQHL